MRQKGIENYSFDDTDFPFIVNILRFVPKIASISRSTGIALNNIKEDRHATNHSSENEPEEELYLRALVSLRDLQVFLHIVDLNETTIPDEMRVQFVQSYSKAIADLKLEIYNDCIETFQVKKDVQLILSSDNQADAFSQIYESYWKKARLSEENKSQYSQFVIAASDAGVKNAHSYAAFEYEQAHDYEEAAHRYEMMISGDEKLTASNAHKLTDFINHMYMIGIKPSERMERFVILVKEQGFDIDVTPDGIVWMKRK